MKMFHIFKTAVVTLAQEYGEQHAGYGISPQDWTLLTQKELWNSDQRSQVRGILSEITNVACTIGGIPAIPLPGQFVAALIAHVVSPANYFVASTRAPDTYDALLASGLQGKVNIQPMTQQQMLSLVLAYSGGFMDEPTKSDTLESDLALADGAKA
jgi:hypothetical protein